MKSLFKNKILTLGFAIAFCMVTGDTLAQTPLTTQYLSNYFIINPAYAGMTKNLTMSAGYRSQWAGFAGSPVTFNANGHMSLAANKMGVGLTVMQDNIGSSKTTEINAAYAYHVPITTGIDLSFGLQAGYINYKTDYSGLQIDRTDPKFANQSDMQPNFGAGVLVRSEKYLFSISLPHMLSPTGGPGSLAANLYSKNLYVFAAYLAQVSYRVKLKPSILLRNTNGAPLSIDYYMGLRVDDSYTIGVFTRNFNALGFQAQLNLGDALVLSYTFELPTSTTSSLNFMTNEFMVAFKIAPLKFQNITDVKNF